MNKKKKNIYFFFLFFFLEGSAIGALTYTASYCRACFDEGIPIFSLALSLFLKRFTFGSQSMVNA